MTDDPKGIFSGDVESQQTLDEVVDRLVAGLKEVLDGITITVTVTIARRPIG